MQEDSPETDHDRGGVNKTERERSDRNEEGSGSSLNSSSIQADATPHSTLSNSQRYAPMSESSEGAGSDTDDDRDPSRKGIWDP